MRANRRPGRSAPSARRKSSACGSAAARVSSIPFRRSRHAHVEAPDIAIEPFERLIGFVRLCRVLLALCIDDERQIFLREDALAHPTIADRQPLAARCQDAARCARRCVPINIFPSRTVGSLPSGRSTWTAGTAPRAPKPTFGSGVLVGTLGSRNLCQIDNLVTPCRPPWALFAGVHVEAPDIAIEPFERLIGFVRLCRVLLALCIDDERQIFLREDALAHPTIADRQPLAARCQPWSRRFCGLSCRCLCWAGPSTGKS
jgi:hypothetical protein